MSKKKLKSFPELLLETGATPPNPDLSRVVSPPPAMTGVNYHMDEDPCSRYGAGGGQYSQYYSQPGMGYLGGYPPPPLPQQAGSRYPVAPPPVPQLQGFGAVAGFPPPPPEVPQPKDGDKKKKRRKKKRKRGKKRSRSKMVLTVDGLRPAIEKLTGSGKKPHELNNLVVENQALDIIKKFEHLMAAKELVENPQDGNIDVNCITTICRNLALLYFQAGEMQASNVFRVMAEVDEKSGRTPITNVTMREGYPYDMAKNSVCFCCQNGEWSLAEHDGKQIVVYGIDTAGFDQLSKLDEGAIKDNILCGLATIKCRLQVAQPGDSKIDTQVYSNIVGIGRERTALEAILSADAEQEGDRPPKKRKVDHITDQSTDGPRNNPQSGYGTFFGNQPPPVSGSGNQVVARDSQGLPPLPF